MHVVNGSAHGRDRKCTYALSHKQGSSRGFGRTFLLPALPPLQKCFWCSTMFVVRCPEATCLSFDR